MFGVVVLIAVATANDVAVLAMPKFAEKVASPSTATPTLIESMIAEKIIAFALDAVVLVSALNRIWTAAVQRRWTAIRVRPLAAQGDEFDCRPWPARHL